MTFWKEGGAGASAATTCDGARREEGVIACARCDSAHAAGRGRTGPGGIRGGMVGRGGGGRAGAPGRGLRATVPT